MLGDQPRLLIDAKGVDPGHFVDQFGIRAVAHLARPHHHHHVALGNDRDDRKARHRRNRARWARGAHRAHERIAPRLHVRIVLDVLRCHELRRALHMAGFVDDAPEIEHVFLVACELRIVALQERELIGRAWQLRQRLARGRGGDIDRRTGYLRDCRVRAQRENCQQRKAAHDSFPGCV